MPQEELDRKAKEDGGLQFINYYKNYKLLQKQITTKCLYFSGGAIFVVEN